MVSAAESHFSRWLKKWQLLLLHLECPLPHFEKRLKGHSDICSGVLSIYPCLMSLCFFHNTTPFLYPAVTMNLHQMPVCLAGQTSCCVWHSSFIDGLFFNCSGTVLSFSALTVANPRGKASCWGSTCTCVVEAPLLTLNSGDMQKITCRVVFLPLFSFC